ncbi:MAG: OmpA family protein [Myxococcales bacterium]|nr:OmpA family protein [Myxococcales bacterium]
MSSRDSTISMSVRTVRRYRAAKSGLPFIPWGLLPIVGLFAVALLALTVGAQRWVEADVRDAVEDALVDHELGWVRFAVDGQNVALTGAPPTTGAGDEALAVVEQALGDTWAGALDATERVSGRFTSPPPPAPKPPPAQAWCDFELVRGEGALVLRGQVPSEAARARVVAAAQALVGTGTPVIDRVQDELTVLADGAPVWGVAAERGTEILSRCASGRYVARGGELSVLCSLPEALRDETDEAIRAPLPGVRLGAVELLVAEQVEACEARLQAVLQKSVVEVATASAALRPSAVPVVDAVAEAARDCPGTLRIEGHTDDRGDPAANVELSKARAESILEALVSRGLDRARLVAVGFGAARPVADNATPPGRRKNRRIEIRVVQN